MNQVAVPWKYSKTTERKAAIKVRVYQKGSAQTARDIHEMPPQHTPQ